LEIYWISNAFLFTIGSKKTFQRFGVSIMEEKDAKAFCLDLISSPKRFRNLQNKLPYPKTLLCLCEKSLK
jgi:hypothetical protein